MCDCQKISNFIIIELFSFPFFSAPEGAYRLTKHDPWRFAAIPLPHGKHLISVRLMPFLAKIAVSLFCTSMFVFGIQTYI